MIIRAPTRTKTKSFKGDQMDFKFPSTEDFNLTHEHISSIKDETKLNNHYLVNASLKDNESNSNSIEEERQDKISPLLHSPISSNDSDKLNTNSSSSNGYYSFANISDNTTSPQYFHDRISSQVKNEYTTSGSDNNDDIISILRPGRSDYPYTLAPTKKSEIKHKISIGEIESYTNRLCSDSFTSENTNSNSNTHHSIPTADNISYNDLISGNESTSLFKKNTNKYNSRTSFSSSSISMKRGAPSVKRTPMNLHRKPTMKRVDSFTFSSSSNDSSRNTSNASSNLRPQDEQNHLNQNSNNEITQTRFSSTYSTPASTMSSIQTKENVNTKPTPVNNTIASIRNTVTPNNKTAHNNIPKKPLRSQSIRRSTSIKSNLKRSNAVRCKGGLLEYFRILGIKIKSQLKKLRHLLRRKSSSSSTGYNSKGYVNKSSNASLHKLKMKPVKKTTSQIKKMKNGNTIPHHASDNNVATTSHLMRTQGYVSKLQRDTSYKSLEPVVTISKKPTISKTPASPTLRSPPTTTNSTLRRTNSSIRRAASILTASTPSTTTYYSTMTHQDSSISSPIRKSKLIKSNASTSLNSLVRQQSIVVKNKVIPLSMSQYSISEENENCNKSRDESNYRMNEPTLNTNNEMETTFDTIREEEEEDNSINKTRSVNTTIREESLESDSGSSIFTDINLQESLPDRGMTEEEVEEEEENITDLENEDDEDEEDHTEEMKSKMNMLMNDYMKQVIHRRIVIRLQMTKFQESNVMGAQYKQLLGTLLSDYETEYSSAHVFDDNNFEGEESETSDDEEEEDSENGNTEDESSDKISPMSMDFPSRNLNSITVKPLFGSSHSNSIISLPTSTVKRSLTLPVGIKI